MKHIKHWLMTVAVLLCSVTASAEMVATFNVDGIWYETNDNSSLTVDVITPKDGTKYSGAIEIPSRVEYSANSWKINCVKGFTSCPDLTSVAIPNTVWSVYGAFSGSSNLESITCKASNPPAADNYTFSGVNKETCIIYVPASAVDAYKDDTYWGAFANIQPISIASGACGDNLTWKLTDEAELIIEGTGTMADYTPRQSPWYANRTSIRKISMSSGITSVGNYAFYGLTELLSVEFSKDITSIGDYAFYGCGKLTSIELPKKLNAINYRAFSNCSSVVSIAIPDGVTSISSCAFEQCTALTTVSFPENLVSIDEMAFYLCESIESLVIPSKVEIIGRQAFDGCSNMVSVALPDQLNSIYDYAFSYCESLVSITIPASVKSIGTCVFSGCKNLTSIIVAAGNQTYDSRDNCNAIIETNSNTLISGSSATIIPNTVTSIGEFAFYGHTKLTSVIVPKNVTALEMQLLPIVQA